MYKLLLLLSLLGVGYFCAGHLSTALRGGLRQSSAKWYRHVLIIRRHCIGFSLSSHRGRFFRACKIYMLLSSTKMIDCKVY